MGGIDQVDPDERGRGPRRGGATSGGRPKATRVLQGRAGARERSRQEAPARTTRIAAAAIGLALLAAACTSSDIDDPTVASSTGATPSATDDQEPQDGPAPLIDPDEIISGGPPPDGIPPIDEPTFLEPAQVDFLEPPEPVIAVEVDGVAKAYPIRILMWHEIVNDDFDGTPVVVTYCPLCNTGIAFERPTIDGELLDFGTSGKLYNSNLVMYDRQTESYWPQATGQAVMGPLTGTELDFVPARILSWADWFEAHPEGLVLSQDTGHRRDYGSNPYVGYEDTDDPFLFRGEVDPRLPATEHVLGIAGDDDVIAFPYSELARQADAGSAVVQGTFGGQRLVVFWQEGTASALDAGTISESADIGAAAAYVPVADGQRLSFEVRGGDIVDAETGTRWAITGHGVEGPMAGTQLEVGVAIDSFWFDWAAFHPETSVYGQG